MFGDFSPKIPASYADSEYLFLANIDPVLQENVRSQMSNVRMVCGDTMNYWITGHTEKLARVLKGLDALLINDTEAKMLAKNNNLVGAAKAILGDGTEDADCEAWRIRRDGLLQRALIRQRDSARDAAVSRACIAAGRGG